MPILITCAIDAHEPFRCSLQKIQGETYCTGGKGYLLVRLFRKGREIPAKEMTKIYPALHAVRPHYDLMAVRLGLDIPEQALEQIQDILGATRSAISQCQTFHLSFLGKDDLPMSKQSFGHFIFTHKEKFLRPNFPTAIHYEKIP